MSVTSLETWSSTCRIRVASLSVGTSRRSAVSSTSGSQVSARGTAAGCPVVAGLVGGAATTGCSAVPPAPVPVLALRPRRRRERRRRVGRGGWLAFPAGDDGVVVAGVARWRWLSVPAAARISFMLLSLDHQDCTIAFYPLVSSWCVIAHGAV